ncbi:MAG: hypothetical protein J5I41_12605 [Saprospiraceae bacterium]|nr:hypothetical protein [Saprospiraceae bacterium]
MKDFDKKIGDRLREHTTTRPADAWDRFNRQMNASSPPSDEAFESFVRHRLEHHQTHHTEAIRHRHWQTLRTQMELAAFRLKELWISKCMEATLFLLIFSAIWPVDLSRPDVWPPDAQPRQENSAPRLIPATPDMPPMANLPEQVRTARAVQARIPEGQASAIHDLTEKEFGTKPLAGTTTDQPSLIFPRQSAEMAMLESGKLSSPAAGLIPATDEGILASLPHPAPAPVTLSHEPAFLPLPVLPDPKIRFSQRVSMAVNGDIHFIETPYDHLLGKVGYNQLSGSYGFVLGYSWEGRKWGLRSQMGYRHVYYLPKPYTEVFDGDIERGYFTETLRNIELNLLSVGIMATRQIARQGAWNTYGLAGGTMHVAFLANYDRKQKYLPGSDPLPSGELPEPVKPSLTSQKRYPDGLFEGGNLEENYYLSMDLGIGIERHLGGRISLFAEPVFHYNPFRRSLGPNNDRIHTLSIYSGIRVLL